LHKGELWFSQRISGCMANIWHSSVEPERGKPVTPTKLGVIPLPLFDYLILFARCVQLEAETQNPVLTVAHACTFELLAISAGTLPILSARAS
jgi:hypothetical protein